MLNKFTQEELFTLSDGLLALIDKVSEAKKLIYNNEKIQYLLDEEIKKYQELNSKVLNSIDI